MRRVLAHRDFRLLWLSQAGSTVADRLVAVAIALYVNRIGTPTDVGIVLAAQLVPFVGLLLLGGVWADRLPRHRVMVVSDVARGALHGLLAVLILTGTAEVWHLVVIEALYGAAHAFFRPAYTGLVPQTVPEEDLQEAQAVTFMSNNVANVTGPALAALLVVTIGAGAAFVIDAATFFVSATLLLRVRPRERGTAPPAEHQPVLADLADGFREVRSRPWVGLVITSASLGLMIGFSPFQALGPAIADDGYGQAAVFGLVSAMFGVGSVLGSVLALRLRPARPVFWGLLACTPWSLNFIAFALEVPLVVLIPFGVASGAGISLFMVWWETALARGVPPEALSRVSSFDWMGSLGLAPIGLILAGPIAAQLGNQTTLVAGAALATAVNVLVAFTPAIRRHGQPNSGTPVAAVEASAYNR
jgi:predicted MFS family arabinose efflux permease